jgi:hypothetical protein
VQLQYEFRQQDIQRGELQRMHRQRGQQDLQEQEFLEQQAQEWHERCWVCTQNRLDADHDLYQCTAAGSHQARQWYLQWRGRIRYAPYVSCYRCGMPQTVCAGHTVGAGQCAYRGVLMGMLAMMLLGELEDTAAQAVVARAQGLWQQQLIAHGVDYIDDRSVVQFLGQETERRWMRQTELVAGFIWLRRFYQRYRM